MEKKENNPPSLKEILLGWLLLSFIVSGIVYFVFKSETVSTITSIILIVMLVFALIGYWLEKKENKKYHETQQKEPPIRKESRHKEIINQPENPPINLNYEKIGASEEKIVNPDVIIAPTEIYDEDGNIIMLLKKRCPTERKSVIKYLFEKDIAFSSERWDIHPETKIKIYERMNLLPEPNHIEVRDIIEKSENRDIFLKKEVLESTELYKLGKIVRDITEQSYKEKISKDEYLLRLNTVLDDNQLSKVSALIDNFIGVIEPTKRMRRKGLERLEYYWDRFLKYNIQDNFLVRELSLIYSNVYALNMYEEIKKDEDVRFYKIHTHKTQYHDKIMVFDIGFGQNIVPKELCPLLLNPDYSIQISYVFEKL